jgi:hypothetical protein
LALGIVEIKNEWEGGPILMCSVSTFKCDR